MSRILAIDDNLDNLITLQAMLNLFIEDCEIFTATSGHQGIEMAIEEQPDTILLDIHMPGIDGFETCRLLKQNGKTSHIPVIILTAISTDSKSRVKALELGADAFLSKPINETELAAQVKAMLRIKRAEDSLRDENQYLEELVAHRVRDLKSANHRLSEEITKRKRVQYALAMKADVIENSLNAFNIVDKAGKFIYVNKAYVQMWGYDSAEEIIGSSQENHFLDPAVWRQITDVVKRKGKKKLECKAIKRDGSSFEVLSFFHLVHNESGDELYSATSIDITEQKHAQKEKQKIEKQLLQAQKMEAVGVLAGGIAHDFNNILSPILGYSELLKEDIPPSNPFWDSVDEIQVAAEKARDLVKQILTFSRQMDQEIGPIAVQAVLKEAIKLSNSVIPKNISIKDDIDPDCGAVLADSTQVHQMIMNIITNACHSMQEHGGTLSFAYTEVDIDTHLFKNKNMIPGRYAFLKISDTGVGIEKGDLPRIFDLYFTTKDLGEGTGLGLSVVHGIVKNIKGEIFVDSRRGEGTSFEIYLPVHTEKPVDDAITPDISPRGTEKILLVDDETHVRNVETRMLEKLGYHVNCQGDPLQALELYNRQPESFDLLITDLAMPQLGGIQLARKVLDHNPSFPVILCTGFSDTIKEDLAYATGVKAVLMKPVIFSELAQSVRRVLDQRGH